MAKKTCPRCNGDGTIICPKCTDGYVSGGVFTDGHICKRCGGSNELQCPACGGSGKVEKN